MKALKLGEKLAHLARVQQSTSACAIAASRLCDVRWSSQAANTPEKGDNFHNPSAFKYDPIDLEFDRFNGSAAAAEMRERKVEPLGRPVDLEVEMDRDDDEIVDMEALFTAESSSDIELEGVEMDDAFDDEYDRMHDRPLLPKSGQQGNEGKKKDDANYKNYI